MGRIGIDGTAIAGDGKGNARGQRKLVESLVALGLGHELVAFVRTPDAAAELSDVDVRTVVIGDGLTITWEQVGMPKRMARHRLDVLLTMTERLPLVGGGPYVVWLYELPTNRIRANRARGAGAYQRASDLMTQVLWRRSLRRAARVLAGSEATAAELRDEVPELGDRLRVVYPGLFDGFAPGPGKAGPRYVFHLASSDPRDNTETALAAFAAARPRLSEPARLFVAGGLGARREAVESEVVRLGLSREVELFGRVSDAELVDLYRGAAVYLDPTLFEGFGYQVLEAMACGAPVVASRTTSIPEVVGEAGILCDPRSPEELAGALVRVLEDPVVAGDLRRRGLERSRRFTWDGTARAVADVLQEVIAGEG